MFEPSASSSTVSGASNWTPKAEIKLATRSQGTSVGDAVIGSKGAGG
jgi:hypothetical protein